ncbi:DNA-binding domain-containing protein [Telmatobacter sp. DSM 110680]|uniref:DNA-binding domain-containing protein n=1 Tax=Telmatobacter sp. DSM 110680 TaxID=3036704 RepID=A0AAU7DFY7_9BACT
MNAMTLAQLQREMASAVMMPLTPDEEMGRESPDGRPMDQVAATFIAPNSKLSPFERLEIYNRQYWFRVLGALAEDFPALRSVIGARSFEAMSVAYLSEHPSRSFSLRNLGSHLAEWLSKNPHFAGRRARLAHDVARMEWAFVEAFDGAERDPLTLEQISTLDGSSKLGLQPHLQLVALEFPVDDLVLKLHKHEKRQTSEAGVKHEDDGEAPAKLPPLRPRPTWLAAHRVDFSVYYLGLKRGEFQTLAAIRSGMPLAQAIEIGITSSRVPSAKRPQLVRQLFTNWSELGWICAPDIEDLHA